MKNKFIIIITFLILLVIYLNIKLRQINDSKGEEMNRINYSVNQMNAELEEYKELQRINLNFPIIMESVKSELNQKLELEKNNVIVYFNEHHCRSCVKTIELDLCLLNENYEFNNIHFVGDFEKESDFKDFSEDLNTEFNSFALTLFPKESFNNQNPIVFVLDKNGSVGILCSPELSPSFRQDYFTRILPFYLGLS